MSRLRAAGRMQHRLEPLYVFLQLSCILPSARIDLLEG